MLTVVNPTNGKRRLFYARPHSPDDDPPLSAASGLRGWAEVRVHRLTHSLETSEGTTARLARNVWNWLHQWSHPDELLLARLRQARAIDLHHPAGMSDDEVLAAWSAFLRRGQGRHWPWFLFNLMIAPLTVLLALLPGPNLVGYWFVYRALHHGLILHGVRRAQSGGVETRLHSLTELDHTIHTVRLHHEQPHLTSHLAALGCDPDDVLSYLRRHGVQQPPGSPPEPPLNAASPNN